MTVAAQSGAAAPATPAWVTGDFLGVRLHGPTTEQFLRALVMAAKGPHADPWFVTYLNAWCSNVAARDAEYRNILNSSTLVYADGQGVVWGARWRGVAIPERVNAGDFVEEFARVCAGEGVRLFLLGSYEGAAAGAAARLADTAPGLEIVGTAHGFFTDGGAAAAAAVRAARPDILLVGMGVPQQELWAWSRRAELGVPVIWCVGALFEYYSGLRRRAPVWMRRAGLEWLVRLVLEPQRMARRYLIGNAVFVWRVLTGRREGG